MKKRGERLLGPYEDRNGWRVIEVAESGKRSSTVFETEARAQRYIELMQADLSTEAHTTETALTAYVDHLTKRGTKEQSRDVTEWAIKLLFPDPILLSMLSTKRCQKLYDELVGRPSERTGKPMAVDTHRAARDRASCFLSWCVGRGWLSVNPLKGVRGIGRKRPRGKSLGKSGNEIRSVKQARAWYYAALEMAQAGDVGAIGGLMALLLGLRASEIVLRRVGDLDEDEAAGDLLWIPCSKTAAGRRTLEVPEVLRPYLVACAANKAADRYLFEWKPGKPHTNQWPIAQVRRICDKAGVPQVTAHAMRGLLATITAERGLAGHLIAATLGHEDSRISMTAYARPGAESAGDRRRGLVVLNGGAK
jgi:integrase